MRRLKQCLYLILVFSLLLLISACSKSPQLPPLSPSAKILAFGDSITAGYGAAEAESYPANLAQLTARRVVNAGIPGEVSADGLLRLPEVLEREKPALLILCHGGNDLLRHLNQQQLGDNLRGMVKLAREKGIFVILVAVPAPDLSLKPPPLYEEVAREFDLPLEGNTLAKIMGKGSLKSDHIHPNANGYRILAESLFSLLNKCGAL